MKEMKLVLENVGVMAFAAGITSVKEIHDYYNDETACHWIYEIADAMVQGLQIDDSPIEEVMHYEMNGEQIEIPVCEIPVFNTNKEIMASNFFTPEQAEYVRDIAKRDVSEYYKTWNTGYRSEDKELIEVFEYFNGGTIARLGFDGTFTKDNLFFIKADILPYKKNSIIAIVGYKNPDDSITYTTFGDISHGINEIEVSFDSKIYYQDEFEKAFS